MGEEDTEILFLSFQAETAKITMNRAIKSTENVGVKKLDCLRLQRFFNKISQNWANNAS